MDDTRQLKAIGNFRFWCQKVLPAVYDDSLSYYELLCKVIQKLNEVIELSNSQSEAIKELEDLMEQFLSGNIEPYVLEKIAEWFEENEPEIVAEIAALQEDEANYNTLNDIAHLNKIQERFETNGSSRFPLELNSNIAEPVLIGGSTQYLPFAMFYYGMQQCSLIGDFKAIADITNTSEDNIIFTTYLRPSQNWVVHDCLMFNDNEGNLRTSSLIWQPDGTLRYFSPETFTLPEGAFVHIDQGSFTTVNYHKDFDFPVVTQNDILLANAWIQNHQNAFDYTNLIYEKCNAVESGATDCSGLIFNAFYYGATKMIPNFTDAQAGFGKIIAFARKGEDLDFTDAIMGDLVIYIHENQEEAHHCCWYDGYNLWEVDTAYTGGQSKGPQIVAGGTVTNENYLKTNDFRYIIRWSEHYANTYNWSNLIS